MTKRTDWLPQRQPGQGAVLLRDYPGAVILVDCPRCGRAGRYALARLVERFGPAAGLPDVLAVLAADCPRRGVGRFTDPCGAGLPELVRASRGTVA